MDRFCNTLHNKHARKVIVSAPVLIVSSFKSKHTKKLVPSFSLFQQYSTRFTLDPVVLSHTKTIDL